MVDLQLLRALRDLNSGIDFATLRWPSAAVVVSLLKPRLRDCGVEVALNLE